MRTIFKRFKSKHEPKPNAYSISKDGERTPFYFDLASSAKDIDIKCGACGEAMAVEGEDVVCSCGNRENADDFFHDIFVVGPAKGLTVILYPAEDEELAS